MQGLNAVGMHRVAIVVFCEAEGVDERDAASVAQRALIDNLHDVDLTVNRYEGGKLLFSRRTTFIDATEVGVAAGNGYLWTQPTSKAFRENS